MDLLFCNSFLQHHPTPLAGHRQEKTEKKHVSEGWHRAFLCSKQKPIYIICKWVYFVDKTFTNGKGRGYNAQNLLKKNGIDFEHFAFMGFVFWITKTQQGSARKQSVLTLGRSRSGKQRWRKLQHTAAVPEPTSTIRRRIRPTLKHITAPPGRRSGRTRKKMWMFWSAWQAPAAPTLARLAICESRIRHLKSCWYSPIRIPALRQSIRTFRLSTGFCPCMVCLKANCLTICGRKVYFCLSIIIFAKGKGSSARTFVRDRTPFLIRRVNHKRCLCIIAIQLFNATATALNCISQICCLNVALISCLAIKAQTAISYFIPLLFRCLR